MRAHELTIERTLGVTFDHGEDFFDALSTFCRENGVRQGYIPSFIGAFAEAEIVGACEKLENPDAPVWSMTYVTNVEAFGAGTLAHDPESGAILPHIHVSVGLKAQSADDRTSHLLSAKVQFLSELLGGRRRGTQHDQAARNRACTMCRC
ncbi:PPC domain-containing DNA-binding protein [Streptomyces sp. NPDC049585]|uniref:PPC domain-containing DNA-binding protein n=1 Tax=Streptomyces sp. NPDC049585 TaxID=3155154 RepID=UPI00343955B0